MRWLPRQVFVDEEFSAPDNAGGSHPPPAPPVAPWASLPGVREGVKENERAATAWAGERLPQRPGAGGAAAASAAAPPPKSSLDVFVDEQFQGPPEATAPPAAQAAVPAGAALRQHLDAAGGKDLSRDPLANFAEPPRAAGAGKPATAAAATRAEARAYDEALLAIAGKDGAAEEACFEEHRAARWLAAHGPISPRPQPAAAADQPAEAEEDEMAISPAEPPTQHAEAAALPSNSAAAAEPVAEAAVVEPAPHPAVLAVEATPAAPAVEPAAAPAPPATASSLPRGPRSLEGAFDALLGVGVGEDDGGCGGGGGGGGISPLQAALEDDEAWLLRAAAGVAHLDVAAAGEDDLAAGGGGEDMTINTKMAFADIMSMFSGGGEGPSAAGATLGALAEEATIHTQAALAHVMSVLAEPPASAAGLLPGGAAMGSSPGVAFAAPAATGGFELQVYEDGAEGEGEEEEQQLQTIDRQQARGGFASELVCPPSGGGLFVYEDGADEEEEEQQEPADSSEAAAAAAEAGALPAAAVGLGAASPSAAPAAGLPSGEQAGDGAVEFFDGEAENRAPAANEPRRPSPPPRQLGSPEVEAAVLQPPSPARAAELGLGGEEAAAWPAVEEEGEEGDEEGLAMSADPERALREALPLPELRGADDFAVFCDNDAADPIIELSAPPPAPAEAAGEAGPSDSCSPAAGEEPAVRVNPFAEGYADAQLAALRPALAEMPGVTFHGEAAGAAALAALRAAKRATRANSLPVTLGDRSFMCQGIAGQGAFAIVFEAVLVGGGDGGSDDDEEEEDEEDAAAGSAALKLQAPPFPWEFAAGRLLAARLGAAAAADVAMPATELHVLGGAASVLVSPFGEAGTLQDVLNAHLAKGERGMDEVLAAFYVVEMLRVLEAFHAAGLLHGDVKPDNLLVRNEVAVAQDWAPGRPGCWARRGLRLIDLGRTVDLAALPPGAGLQGDSRTSAFRCPEMAAGRPWRYQPDTYGLLCTAHALLFGRFALLF